MSKTVTVKVVADTFGVTPQSAMYFFRDAIVYRDSSRRRKFPVEFDLDKAQEIWRNGHNCRKIEDGRNLPDRVLTLLEIEEYNRAFPWDRDALRRFLVLFGRSDRENRMNLSNGAKCNRLPID